MPLLKAQDVAPFLILEEKTLEHLRRTESERSRIGFCMYVAQYGIRDLGELSESQLFALSAARNLSSVIDLLQIPSSKTEEGQSGYEKYDLHREKTSLSPSVKSFLSMAPSHDQELEVLRHPEDIPQAIPEDQLLRRRAPQEFLRRLTEGELLYTAWVQGEEDTQTRVQQQAPDEGLREGQKSAPEDTRPYGYLLLDASESMGTGRDQRSEVSRGAALAFLLSQFQSGNPTSLFLFRHELSPQIGGESRTAFEEAVVSILRHPYEGMTNLQGALKLLSEQLVEKHERVDIALITDGITRLTEKPFDGVHLHTFLLGARPEEFDSFGNAQYQESIFKLRSWSDFMFRFSPEIMQRVSIPRREDVLDFGKILRDVDHEWSDAGTSHKLKRVQRRLHNLIAFINRYRDAQTMPDAEIDALLREAREAEKKIGTQDTEEVAFHNAMHWTPLDRELMHALETRESASILDQQTAGTVWKLKTEPVQYTNLFEALRMLFRHLLDVILRRGK